MPDERLLERIQNIGKKGVATRTDTKYRCIDSILSHLQRILNTRQGSVLLAGDYGIPDFLDFLRTHPESVHQMERSIGSTVEKYEPRLSEVTVTYQPEEDSLSLRFRIVATLTSESRKVCFQTLVDGSGRVHVSR